MTALDNVATGMLYTGAPRDGAPGGGPRGARARRPRPPAQPPPAAALRRRAPAGRDRPRAREATSDHPRRRADRQPRLQVRRRGRRAAARARLGRRDAGADHPRRADRRLVSPPGRRCATARSSPTSADEHDRCTDALTAPCGSRDVARLPPRELLGTAIAGPAHSPAARRAVGTRDRDRDRRDGRGGRRVLLEPGQPARRDRRARHQSARRSPPVRTSPASNEVLPDTSVPMIGTMPNVRQRRRRLPGPKRERVPRTPYVAVRADRRDRRRRRRATTCPQVVGTLDGLRPLPRRGQRPLPGGRARRPGGPGPRRSRTRRRPRDGLPRQHVVHRDRDPQAGAARLRRSTRPCSSRCRSPSACSSGCPTPPRSTSAPNQNDVIAVANLLAATADPQNADWRRRQPPVRRARRRAPPPRASSRRCCSASAPSRCSSARSGSPTSWSSRCSSAAARSACAARSAPPAATSASQFLTESALLAALGGIAGLLLGGAGHLDLRPHARTSRSSSPRRR